VVTNPPYAWRQNVVVGRSVGVTKEQMAAPERGEIKTVYGRWDPRESDLSSEFAKFFGQINHSGAIGSDSNLCFSVLATANDHHLPSKDERTIALSHVWVWSFVRCLAILPLLFL
jgi:hypothetical protein